MHSILFLICLWAAQDKPPAAPPPADKPAAEKQTDKPADAKPTPPPTQESAFKTLGKQFTIGGQIRIRGEYRDPTSYASGAAVADASTRSDDLFLTRIRLNLKFSVNDDIDVFVQPQDQRVWGQEASVLNDERNLDLHQGFVDVRNLFSEPLSIKAGRMELQYGDGRLVSPLDWSNIGRAWDGAKVRYAPKDWWIEGFYTVIRDPLAVNAVPGLPPPQPAGVVNGAAEDQDFMGLYFSYIGIADHEFDVYGFFREFQDNSFTAVSGAVGDLIDHTIGVRFKGKAAGFDYSAEVMSQSGHLSVDHISAYAYVATFGYTVDMDWKPRLGVEYTFASGDRTAGNDTRNTFDPLFPFNHYYQGFADIVGFRNSKDLMVALSVKPTDTLSLHLDWHSFWLVESADAWYGDNGAVLRAAAPGTSNKLANEIDLHARLTVSKAVKFWGGWSHVFAGPHIRQTAGANTDTDMNWFFLQMVVDF